MTEDANRLATMEDYAEIEFEAWNGTIKDCVDMEKQFGIPVRLAWATMLRSKQELVKGMYDLGEEPLDELLDGWKHAKAGLQAVMEMMTAAELRVLSALSAAEVVKEMKRGKRRKTTKKMK